MSTLEGHDKTISSLKTLPPDALGSRVVSKVMWRLLPFMVLLYFINQVDRVNISFASLTMNRDIGLTATMYGFGAGIFFIGYFLFEVPSNLLMQKFGARRWMFRIMLTWGAISAAMAFTNSNVTFYVLRFLMGLAEAGFVPGMFLYLSYWIPREYRGRATGLFLLAAPATPVLAGPISSLLLEMNGIWGLHGWQWMFILEGLPAVILSFVTLWVLTDKPSQATWLASGERKWLEDKIAAEAKETELRGHHTLADGFKCPKVILLTAIYLFLVIGLLGMAFFLPQIVKAFGMSNLQVGFVVAIPYGLAALACVYWPKRSDLAGERRWNFALACFVATAAFLVAGLMGQHWLAIVPISIALMGVYGALPIFWTIPGYYLTGVAAAAGLAWINSIGNLGGFLGPYLVGWLREASGDFTTAVMCLAIGPFLAGCLVLFLPRETSANIK